MIQSIRDKQPTYNLITNNCQTYALELLDAVKVGGYKKFGTTLAVYERMTGKGKIIDLFNQPGMEGQTAQTPPEGEDTVSLAQGIMNANTTQLDTREEQKKHSDVKRDLEIKAERDVEEKKDKKGLKGMLSRFTRSS